MVHCCADRGVDCDVRVADEASQGTPRRFSVCPPKADVEVRSGSSRRGKCTNALMSLLWICFYIIGRFSTSDNVWVACGDEQALNRALAGTNVHCIGYTQPLHEFCIKVAGGLSSRMALPTLRVPTAASASPPRRSLRQKGPRSRVRALSAVHPGPTSLAHLTAVDEQRNRPSRR